MDWSIIKVFSPLAIPFTILSGLCGIIILFSLYVEGLQKLLFCVILGIFTTLSAGFSAVCFYALLKSSGGPDFGKEFAQFYFPLIIYTLFFLGGILFSVLHSRKLSGNTGKQNAGEQQ